MTEKPTPEQDEREYVAGVVRELAGTLHSADHAVGCPCSEGARYEHLAKAIAARFVNVHQFTDDELEAIREAQPIQLVARYIVYAWLTDSDREPAWEDYPEVGERDWERVVEEVKALGRSVDPGLDEFKKAYQQLADRAEKV